MRVHYDSMEPSLQKLVIVIAGRPQQAVQAGGNDRHPPLLVGLLKIKFGAVILLECETIHLSCVMR